MTNAPPELLSLREACVLARLRWQVELLVKLWKSSGRLDESAADKPYRVLCKLLARISHRPRRWGLTPGLGCLK